MLSFSSFSKKYDRRLVLDLGTIELPKGVVWLEGVNGAGKSTLMKCASGILSFKGDVSLIGKGYSLKKQSVDYRREVSISEAEPVFPAFLKGIEIIDLFTDAKNGCSEEATSLIERLDARSFIYERIGSYSSGMNKKLSLILAFIGNPSVILLDEPLVTLDKNAQTSLNALILERHSNGVNFLISSHQSLFLHESIFIKRIMLSDGKIVDPV